MGIAEDLIIIILVGLITGLIAHRFRIPPIIGYIIAGLIIGPYAGLISGTEIHEIELLAEIGVALLLFSIGLDFSFRELKAVRSVALIGAPLQIVIIVVAGYGLGRFMGFGFNESLVMGMVLSLSSTMVVLKTLMSRGLIGTLSSRVMIGILIVQDLAAIPMMLVIPTLGDPGTSILPLLLTLGKALGILAAIILVGLRVIPPVLRAVSMLESRELFLITVTALGLGIGYLTHAFGLSLAFGAFIAGMVVNESDYSHQALNDIIPLRDIFGLVFFTSIGMLLDPVFVMDNILTVLALVVLVLVGKFAIFSTLSVTFRYRNIMPLALGFGLAQIGEFSFVLARTALKHNVIATDLYSLMLSVSVITMMVSPFLSLLAAPLYSLRKRWRAAEEIRTVNIEGDDLSRHVVIAGGGRVGFQIANSIAQAGFQVAIIEQDYRNFERARVAGFPVIYGDAEQEPVLWGAGIQRASLLIVTIPHITVVRGLIREARRHNEELKVIARTDDVESMQELFALDIYEVVQPEFEASIEIIRQSLHLLGVPLAALQEFVSDMRRKTCTRRRLDGARESVLMQMKETPFLLEMNWYEVPSESPVVDKTLGELEIRTRTGASVVGVLREGSLVANPEAGFRFSRGDYIACIGLPEQQQRFAALVGSKEQG